jgi:hypothetical protein
MTRSKKTDTFQPENSPIGWFAELQLATDQGDSERAAESRHQLDRLGWRVSRKRTYQKHRAPHPSTTDGEP